MKSIKPKEGHIKLKIIDYSAKGSFFIHIMLLFIFPDSLKLHQISDFIVAGIFFLLSIMNISLGSNIKQYHKPLIINKLKLKVYNPFFFACIVLIGPINNNIKKEDYSTLLVFISLFIFFFSLIRIKRISQKDL